MHTTRLELETVTPMFLRGSDNRTLELRPPPFKALFRYWWRAVVGETNVDLLRNREANLFGNTKKRSPLSIRISGQGLLAAGARAPLPHRQNFTEQAYLPNGRFTLTLTVPRGSPYEEIAEIGFLLGSVGNRSRRGFGSIRYQQGWNFQTVSDLQNKVQDTLDRISLGRFAQNGNTIEVDHTIPIPAYPVVKAVHFGQKLWNDVNDLLKHIGQVTSSERANGNDAVGSADPRMASPLIVRVHRIDNTFVPVVTQLNSIFPGPNPNCYKQKQADFINGIFT